VTTRTHRYSRADLVAARIMTAISLIGAAVILLSMVGAI
jgi:hypothetical protein